MSHLSTIEQSLEGFAWFYDLEKDQFDRLVVYVHYMDSFIIKSIHNLCGEEVLIHFASHKNCRARNYVKEINLDDILSARQRLVKEIERLESMCSKYILQDIFYEIHDGKNAITNLSFKFPEIKSLMENLYKTYGFDKIYKELEG